MSECDLELGRDERGAWCTTHKTWERSCLRTRLKAKENELKIAYDLIAEVEKERDQYKEALKELVEDYEESDKYPTSDEHPLYKARDALKNA